MYEYEYKVNIPEGELDGIRVERFTVSDFSSGMSFIKNPGRGVPAGEYTRLIEGKHHIWMSDTPAEWWDHWPIIDRLRAPTSKRVLINGLGLGMVIQAALDHEHVEHVDVVESDKRVISLVGPYYTIDERVTIHHADAFEQSKTWPKDTRWNLAWHDIWADLCEDNLQEMFKLHRSYGRRVDWQGSWGKEDLIRQRIRERRERGWDDE